MVTSDAETHIHRVFNEARQFIQGRKKQPTHSKDLDSESNKKGFLSEA